MTVDGNRIAHLWRDAFATESDPLEGIQLGWKGQDHANAFITSVIENFEEMIQHSDDPQDIVHEVADVSVPAYTSEILATVTELPLWVLADELDTNPGEITIESVARYKLYDIAVSLATTLAEHQYDAANRE